MTRMRMGAGCFGCFDDKQVVLRLHGLDNKREYDSESEDEEFEELSPLEWRPAQARAGLVKGGSILSPPLAVSCERASARRCKSGWSRVWVSKEGSSSTGSRVRSSANFAGRMCRSSRREHLREGADELIHFDPGADRHPSA